MLTFLFVCLARVTFSALVYCPFFCLFQQLINKQTKINFHAYLFTCILTYLLTYLLTYSMEQTPSWEANRFSASQEIPHILWNPKVHFRIHKFPPPAPVLSHLDPVHVPKSYFLKIHLNIILPSRPGSPKWSLSVRFSPLKPFIRLSSPHTRYMPCPSNSSRFDHTINI